MKESLIIIKIKYRKTTEEEEVTSESDVGRNATQPHILMPPPPRQGKATRHQQKFSLTRVLSVVEIN